MSSFALRVDHFFQISERGSTITREIRGGLVTFLTMSYILLVNPTLLAKAGIPASDGVIATAAGASIASLIMALLANMPFGMAPGIGLSAYLVYGLVLSGPNLKPEVALTCCLIASIVMALFAVTKLSDLIMKLIPTAVKLATVVGMGVLISFIGMQHVNLIVNDPNTLVTVGGMTDWKVWVSLAALAVIACLMYHQVPGAILIGIVVTTIIVWSVDHEWPSSYIDLPKMHGVPFTDFTHLSWSALPGIIGFCFVGIFDVSGVLFGMSRLAGLVDKDAEDIPRSVWAFLASAVGTALASVLGSTPIIIHVESAAGIKEGARTGLAALTVSALFALSLFFAPLFGAVPDTATSPVLIIIGSLMMGEAASIGWDSIFDALPAFLTITLIPLTFSIPYGIAFGLGASIVLFFGTGTFLSYLPERMQCRRCRRHDGDEIRDDRTESLLHVTGDIDAVSQHSHTSASTRRSLVDEIMHRPILQRTPSFMSREEGKTHDIPPLHVGDAHPHPPHHVTRYGSGGALGVSMSSVPVAPRLLERRRTSSNMSSTGVEGKFDPTVQL